GAGAPVSTCVHPRPGFFSDSLARVGDAGSDATLKTPPHSRSSGTRYAYVSVTRCELCPIHFETWKSGVPSETSHEAKVWRRLCGVTQPGSAARFRHARNACVT